MRFFQTLMLIGVGSLLLLLWGKVTVERSGAEGSAQLSGFQVRTELGLESTGDFAKLTRQSNQSHEASSEVIVEAADPTPGIPDWFRRGWTQTKHSRVIGVSLEGQTSIPAATKGLTQMLREEILRELGYPNASDPTVLPQLSPEFIESRLIPEGQLVLQSYEDELTREAAALQGASPAPYYRGFAQASLSPDFFRIVQRWQRYPGLRDSLKWVGLSAGGVIASIALLFGYLKAEHLTHSHYTKRLQTLFASILVALAALFYWLL